jgi:hypothetical protein
VYSCSPQAGLSWKCKDDNDDDDDDDDDDDSVSGRRARCFFFLPLPLPLLAPPCSLYPNEANQAIALSGLYMALVLLLGCANVRACACSESPDPYVINSRGNCYNSLGRWAGACVHPLQPLCPVTHVCSACANSRPTMVPYILACPYCTCSRSVWDVRACFVSHFASLRRPWSVTHLRITLLQACLYTQMSRVVVVACVCAEAREDYLVSSQLFQQAKGFRGPGGSTTQRLDGAR